MNIFLYGEVTKILPDNISKKFEIPVTLTHSDNVNLFYIFLTERLVADIFHIINASLFNWYPNKQATVKTVT